MFNRGSRYLKLAEVVAANKQGTATRSVAFRRNPEVTGRFQHRVDTGDRLDHLAYKYYERSTHWWRVCDANNEFSSPLAMLGKDSVQPGEIKIQWQVDKPEWSSVLLIGENKSGLRNFRLGNNLQPLPALNTSVDLAASPGTIALSFAEEFRLSVLAQTLSSNLRLALEGLGVNLNGAELSIRELAPSQHWQIQRYDTGEILNIQAIESNLLVSPVVQSFQWIVSFDYDTEQTVEKIVFPELENLGIDIIGGLGKTNVIGKVILIPQRHIG